MVELNGSMTTKKRVKAISAFHMSTKEKGYCVLILSNIGLVRLNLVYANIMIIVVSFVVHFSLLSKTIVKLPHP